MKQVLWAVCLMSVMGVTQAALVNNGGFETGDLTE